MASKKKEVVSATTTTQTKNKAIQNQPKTRNPASRSHVENDSYMVDFSRALKDLGFEDEVKPKETVNVLPIRNVQYFGPQSYNPPQSDRAQLFSSLWSQGPIDPMGQLVNFSNRNLLCLSFSPSTNECAVGSADHAVYTFSSNDITSRKRTLHTKTHGHGDWVSCVAHTSVAGGSRVVSGAADGKVCLWSNSSVSCHDLTPLHDGPVSTLKCDMNAAIAVSGGYDKTLRLWDVGREVVSGGRRSQASQRSNELARISGHNAPIMALTWSSNNVMMSGDRDGILLFSDLSSGQKIRCNNIILYFTSPQFDIVSSEHVGTAVVTLQASLTQIIKQLHARAILT